MSEEKDTLYARWLNGELSNSELEQLKASGELEELEAIVNATNEMTLPAYNKTEALQKFRAKHPKRQAKVRRLSFGRIAAIAAAILALVVAYFLFVPSETTILANNQENESHILPDGSTIILNDGSSIQYDASTWAESRTIQLTGEAYFEVSSGETFTVQTNKGSVQVLGTQFNVRAWESSFYVECYEGSVQASAQGENRILTANNSVQLLGNQLDSIKTINHSSPLWRQGILRFYNDPLNEVLNEIGRQYDVNIQAPNFPKKAYTGEIPDGQLDLALDQVTKATTTIAVKSDDGQTIIFSTK